MRPILFIALIISMLALLCSCGATNPPAPKGKKMVRAKKAVVSETSGIWYTQPMIYIIETDTMHRVGDTIGLPNDRFFKYIIQP